MDTKPDSTWRAAVSLARTRSGSGLGDAKYRGKWWGGKGKNWVFIDSSKIVYNELFHPPSLPYAWKAGGKVPSIAHPKWEIDGFFSEKFSDPRKIPPPKVFCLNKKNSQWMSSPQAEPHSSNLLFRVSVWKWNFTKHWEKLSV